MLSWTVTADNIPQWKKDLLQRRQCRNKTAPSVEQLLNARAPLNNSVTVGRVVQQPSPTCTSNAAVAVVGTGKPVLAKCNATNNNNTTTTQQCSGSVVTSSAINSNKMVQERAWTDHNPIKTFELVSKTKETEKNVDSDSSEELQYGPGIVSKLKNRYLNLTLRESSVKNRPSILHMRKATSLEHLIDESDVDDDQDDNLNEGKTNNHRLFESKINGIPKSVPNRYKSIKSDMKRARSVEIISNADDKCVQAVEIRQKRESLHEEMLINHQGSDKTSINDKKMFEINDNKTFSNNIGLRLNRPKRITPVMDEKEKPPLDVVKQTKKLFEKPELRTKPPACTGEVAAKVATYKNIISQTKCSSKKPPIIKQKPPLVTNEKSYNKKSSIVNSRGDSHKLPKSIELNTGALQQKSPDVATLSSPIPDISRVNDSPLEPHHVNGYLNSSLSETPDLILHSSHPYVKSSTYKDVTEDFLKAEILYSCKLAEKVEKVNEVAGKRISTETQQNLSATGNSVVFNFSTSQLNHSHLPNIQSHAENHLIPLTQPLRIDVSSANNIDNKFQTSTPTKASPPTYFSSPIKKQLSPQIPQLSPRFIKASSQKQPSPPTKPPSPQTNKPPSPQTTKLPSPQIIKSSSPQIIKSSPTKFKPSLSPPLKHQNSKPSPKFQNSKPPISPPPKLLSYKSPLSPPLHSPQASPKSLQQPKQHSYSPTLVISTQVEPKIAEQFEVIDRIIEKNLKNVAKSAERPSEKVQATEVTKPKRTARPKQEQNSLVFDFRDRKDVPDYVGNHGPIRKGKIERPKAGEGGITLLPGASLDTSLIDDEEEELLRSLEGPPSPCNVTFINDNVLIDGKSSLRKKIKKPKMSIKFVEDGPDIYEYPSEASLLEDNHTVAQVPATNSAAAGHSVPSLSGSTLATYTPKSTFPTEEFQLGMKPSTPATNSSETKQTQVQLDEESDLHEIDQPIVFSAGTNTDILF